MKTENTCSVCKKDNLYEKWIKHFTQYPKHNTTRYWRNEVKKFWNEVGA